jgi:outer membrane lipoprotein-sorting protein
MKPPRLALAAAVLAVLALAATAWLAHRGATSAAPPPLSADQILEGIAARHRDATHLIAHAHLEVRNHALQSTSQQDGVLTLQRPGKLRWDVAPPASDAGPASPGRSFLSDGVELHTIDFAGSEIMKLHREGHPLVLTTALFTAATWPADYTAALAAAPAPSASAAPHAAPAPGAAASAAAAALAAGGASYTIALTPRSAGPRLFVTADAADFHVRQIVVDDGYNLSRLTLRAVDLATAPDPRSFSLDRGRPPLVAFRFVDASL